MAERRNGQGNRQGGFKRQDGFKRQGGFKRQDGFRGSSAGDGSSTGGSSVGGPRGRGATGGSSVDGPRGRGATGGSGVGGPRGRGATGGSSMGGPRGRGATGGSSMGGPRGRRTTGGGSVDGRRERGAEGSSSVDGRRGRGPAGGSSADQRNERTGAFGRREAGREGSISDAATTRRSSEDGQRQRPGTGRRPAARGQRTSERGHDFNARTQNTRFAKAEPAEAEVNSALIVGRHPVLEALKAGRSINKILLAETAEGGSLVEISAKAKAAGVVVQRVPKAHLDSIAQTTHHQGIAAYAAAHDYVELDEIISRETGHEPLVLLLDEVSDPYNLGAILRTAEATGAQGVVIPKRRAVPLTETVGKAAAGAMEYVPVARVANLVQAMETLKAKGYWIVGTDVEATQSYTDITYQGPIALVIGAEGQGLSRLVREGCDYLVSLPMLGKLQSLNASVATGVLLYEVIRQRH
jgi:23S rRNA (guanosine2251-2'-O)-methyltransferase